MKRQISGYNAVGKPVKIHSSKRLYHHHVIGSTGSGKSKFLEVLMREDLLNGRGFCLIDPHGTLYNDLLKFAAYRNLKREIILLDLSEPKKIIGFNFFSKNKTGDVSVQVDSRLQATLHAWGVENADNTPTLERILRLVYTSLLEADLTLPQIAVLLDFKEKIIREQVIEKIENDLIRREWQELSDLARLKDFRDETLSAKNRLFRLLTSKALMRFLGVQGQTIDLIDAMNNQKVILVNLARSENLSPENARVFGSLLVNQFFEAATQRKKSLSGHDPIPYHLYLDEFQNFVSIDICNALDEIRKFGVFLTLSHQRFGQLNEDIEDAILTNCRIKSVFGGLRTEDARRMAEELFIGKLDPKKIKVAIYQTKHWYRYERDKVYSKSTSHSESEGYSFGTGSGVAGGSSQTSMHGTVTMPPSDDVFTAANWFDVPEVKSISDSTSDSFSSVDSHSEFSGENYSTSTSETEGVADIPIFVPVPFQELSSIQYYTPDEQLLELTQALKLNLQRHCFIQLPDQETQPLLVPFVKNYYVSSKTRDNYIKVKTAELNAITPEEADRQIRQAVENLLQLKSPTGKNEIKAKSDTKKPDKKKATIFDKIVKKNPKLKL
jgi:hypothetical protein